MIQPSQAVAAAWRWGTSSIVKRSSAWRYSSIDLSKAAAKKKADAASYAWDDLIRRFTRHKIRGTSTEIGAAETDPLNEQGVRYMALEPRLARRAYAQSLKEAIASAPAQRPTMRFIGSANPSEPTGYVFLQFPHHEVSDVSAFGTN